MPVEGGDLTQFNHRLKFPRAGLATSEPGKARRYQANCARFDHPHAAIDFAHSSRGGYNPRMFLMLMRHTKSSWSEPGMTDHDRRLNDRGRRGAVAMAEHIANHCPTPAAIICSSAVRTQETLDPIVEALGLHAPEPRLTRAIYEAPASSYLAEIAKVQNGANILIVGHNPTTEALAIGLSGDDLQLRGELATGYPTGGLTILEFADGSWEEALSGPGRFVSFTAPRLLPKFPEAADTRLA